MTTAGGMPRRRLSRAAKVPEDVEESLASAFGGMWRVDGDADELGRVRVAQFSLDEHGRPTVTGVLVLGGPITSDYLRSTPIKAWENSGALSNNAARAQKRAEIDSLPPLERADHNPQQFSELVAQHYRAWAALVPHPVRSISETWQVPLPTVHGWVREARLRQLLPPGDRRKRAEGGDDTKET